MMYNCRFCGSHTKACGHDFNKKIWTHCENCFLYQQDISSLPSQEEEKKRYQEHNNEPEDANYINYLKNSTELLKPHLESHWIGLDYGCGPGPGMKPALGKHVHDVHYYDPIFFPDTTLKNSFYDFITCIEAAEHFYKPKKSLAKIFGLVKDNGFVLIRTEFFHKQEDLETWWYTRDPTHVCLYSLEFFEQAEQNAYWRVVSHNNKNQILLQKTSAFPEQ